MALSVNNLKWKFASIGTAAKVKKGESKTRQKEDLEIFKPVTFAL